ncbi:hypothetical protein ABZ401_19575 [Streptomyces sp. NPDC005892]|uniref:hypothetical protein n=1 Tax=Streptomyces sp. NPDC005892 TaxID=3155593 RepID=UPI0033EA6730
MTFPRYCADCDQSIVGEAEVAVEGFSASGARGDTYRHVAGDPACTGRPAGRSVVSRALDAKAAESVSRFRGA